MRNDKYNLNRKRIIISRTDNLGDVVLCLPVAGVLRTLFPEATLIFLGKAYTRALINCCDKIDEFADWDELKESKDGLSGLQADAIIHVFPRKEIAVAAKKAGIPLRIGSTGRFYHWGRCNRLVRLSRRRSSLHEAQLNLKLLVPLGARRLYQTFEIPDLYGFTKTPHLSHEQKELLQPDRFNLIIHPGSKGSAREWGVANFLRLSQLLPADRYRIFVSGNAAEGAALKEDLFDKNPALINLCGKYNLSELIAFIANADGIVAASTGPLHIAAAADRNAIGIFPPIRPMHPGRWAPLGSLAQTLVSAKNCSKCRKSGQCTCMQEITPEMVCEKLFTIFR
jgi:ADP-heptose:LPS heptosyltransferase